MANEITTPMEPSGRVLPLFRGEYADNVTYENPDIVLFNSSSYVAKQATIGNPPPTDALSNDYWQMVAKGIIDADVSDATVEFEEATERTNIQSGETVKALFGKIKKYLSGLNNIAFSGSYKDLADAPSSLKNPKALNIKFNGTSQASYDGSVAKEINVTPAAISAVNMSTVLNTKEQISANTSASNVTGALAAKAIMTDYTDKINTINSNLQKTVYSNGSPELYERMKYLVDNKKLPTGKPFILREGSYGIVLLVGQIYPNYDYGEFLVLQHEFLNCAYIACIDNNTFRLEKITTAVVQ